MTKEKPVIIKHRRWTRAALNNDPNPLNLSGHMPLYCPLQALKEGQSWFGAQYARGLPTRSSIVRYETAKRATEVIIIIIIIRLVFFCFVSEVFYLFIFIYIFCNLLKVYII